MIELYNDDCLNVFKKLKNECIDLIVTDPPYLMNYQSKFRKDKSHKFCNVIANDGDNQKTKDFLKEVIKECYRVLKNNTAMYMFCNSNHIDFFKQEIENAGFIIKNIIVWVKNNWTAGDLEASYGKQYEFIILANKGRKEINGKRITDVWFFDRVATDKLLHQNQKPVNLLNQCIEKHSEEGDLVLDAFMGSGSTGMACINLKRDFIGIELDEEYFKIAQRRLKKANNNLFNLEE